MEQIFRDYDSGISALRIARNLKEMGVKNAHDRVGWSHASIGRILENYNYLGTEDYEQIIDKELFERVQKRREQVQIEGSRGKHRPNKRERLIFSGVLICAECGYPYSHIQPSHKKERYGVPKWKCKNYVYQNRVSCGGGFISDRQVEEVCSIAINKLIQNPELTEKYEKKEQQVSPELTRENTMKVSAVIKHVIMVPPIAYVQIGNLKIMLHFKEQDDGKYIIENYCDCKIEIAGEYTDGDRFPTSKYTILVAEDFATISNLNFDIIVDELVQTNNPGHISRTTLTLLEMLKAYDKIENQMLLEAATRLADWLNQVDETDVSLINLLQCYYRKREMNEEEENTLEDMIARNREDRQLCAAAYILLGNSKRARSIIDTLTDEQKKVFEEYPVYVLLKS